jgi:hypothetical protein
MTCVLGRAKVDTYQRLRPAPSALGDGTGEGESHTQRAPYTVSPAGRECLCIDEAC